MLILWHQLGQQKETILATFESLIGSLVTYAAPIWFPNTSQTLTKRLQVVQNSTLRIAKGCVSMTAIDPSTPIQNSKRRRAPQHALSSALGHLFPAGSRTIPNSPSGLRA